MTTSLPLTLRDLDNLALVRDELSLQAHLLKADLKDRWLEAETRWDRLQAEARAVGVAVEHSGAELGAAASLLADALRKTYTDLRNALR